MRKQKYFSRPTRCNQMHKHASKKEAKRCDELTTLEKLGRIKLLKQQPIFVLQPKFKFRGKAKRVITYRADFSYYIDGGCFIVEDTKGFKTEAYRMRKKMLMYLMRDREDFDFVES